MIKCPHCYRTVPDGVLKCPHCGGNIVARRATVGAPPRKTGPGVRLAPVLALVVVLVAAVAGGLWLAWPQLQSLLAPGPAAQASPVAAPHGDGTASAPSPTDTPVMQVTPRPPQGWKQLGGAQERFVVWVPESWRTYQAGIDVPGEWRALTLTADPRVADYLASAEVNALLGDTRTRAVALNAPQGIAESQFWPDTVSVRAREDLVGRAPADALAESETQVQDTYGTRNLKIIASSLPTLGSGPACKFEYTWSRTTARGTEVKIHSVELIVFGGEMVYELRFESSEASYANTHAQAYQKMISSFRFSTPVVETPLELPPGWHEVRSDRAGYLVWVPDDWLAYNADADSFQDWTQRVAESYVRGSLYLNGYAAEFERASFVALEPVARRNNTILLGTIQVSTKPDLAGASSGTLAEILRQALAQDAAEDWRVIQSTGRWQHGHPVTYLEATLKTNPDPSQEPIAQHLQVIVLGDSAGPLALQLTCAESQYEEFRATFDTVLKSFQPAP